MPDKEFYLLPAKKDEAASDDGSEDAGEDEQEDDQPVLCIAIHPEISLLVSLSILKYPSFWAIWKRLNTQKSNFSNGITIRGGASYMWPFQANLSSIYF